MTPDGADTAEAGASGRALFIAASRIGDLVFLYDKGPEGWLIRLYQSLTRRVSLKRMARYSHVAIVAGQGLLIHADGRKTIFEPMVRVLPAAHRPEGLRIVRRTGGLTTDEQQDLLKAVSRHDEQPYTLGFGLFALGRRLAARQTGMTLPFCSELATIGYRAIGIPLAEPRRTNEVLPVDVDLSTREDGWTEVTDSYYPSPLPDILPDGSPNPLVEPDLSIFTTVDHMLAEGRRTAFKGWAHILETVKSLQALQSETPLRIYNHPNAFIAHAPDVAARIVGDIDTLYERIAGFPESLLLSPEIDGLAAMFPRLAEDEPPYEGGPSLRDLRALDWANSINRLIHDLVSTLGLLQGLEATYHQGGPTSDERRVLRALPTLSPGRVPEIEAGIARMAMPAAGELQAHASALLLSHQALQNSVAGH